MTLEELTALQKQFDARHKGHFRWNTPITQDSLDMLEFLLISLAGELGETANIVKKIIRGDCSLESRYAELQDEIADMFIYLLKLSYQLDIDLESAYLNKLEKNQERFKHYEKAEEQG